jgi:mannan endo-1,4-beta-mannosidase
VDIVGRDIYKDGDHSSQILEFNDMTSRYGGKKMVTISESGSFPDVDNLIMDGAGWSWFMPWYGGFVTDSKYNSLDLWKKMFASDYVLTLDEMPNLKTYTATSLIQNKFNYLQIYPTYFDETINIRSDKLIQTVSVYNQLGVPIKTMKPETGATIISLAGFPSGMYLVKADDESAVKVFKR